ncbi:hypothetical protein A2U01_0117381, partial [Trifolium medium]|nr:hypothetical protein [Trifolium medium]
MGKTEIDGMRVKATTASDCDYLQVYRIVI